MPRKASPLQPTTVTPAPSMTLTGRAAELHAKVLDRFELDEVAAAILSLACESLQRSDEAAAIVTREGMCVADRWGQPQKHPASLLERDHRAAAAQSLQRLGLSLHGG
jgi:hypothetical protein